MFGFSFDHKVDIGHFLTFVTLVAGFMWWIYSNYRSWHQKSEDDARSGALRLLLKMLRDENQAIALPVLLERFQSPALRELRDEYCGRKWFGRSWLFRNKTQFESAIYRLDFEGKIDFVSPHQIVFRVDGDGHRAPKFPATQSDAAQLVSVLRDALSNKDISVWDLEKLAESCARVSPQGTADLIREVLKSGSADARTRAASVMGRLATQPS